jgi:lipoprotein-releasing system permease protein
MHVAIARRHLNHNIFRTVLSTAGVGLGVCFMVMLSALMSGFQTKFVNETIESSPHVTVYDDERAVEDEFAGWLGRRLGGAAAVASAKPRDRLYRIKKPAEIVELVRRLPGVAAVAENVVGTAIVAFGSREVGANVVGIDPERQESVVATDKYMLSGRLAALRSAGGAVILGKGLADKLGVRAGDTVTARLGGGETRALRVVGVFRTGVITIDNNRAYVLISLAQQLLSMGRDVNRVVVRLRDYEAAHEVAADIEALVGYRTESWQEANENFLAVFVIQQVVTYMVTGGIMIVAGFGILNVLIMLVLEKVPEIAMLKSMGYTARDVTAIFLLEGMAIGLMGIVCGSSAGHYLIEAIGRLPIRQRGLFESEHLIFNNAPSLYVIAGVAAFLVTTVAAVLPAVRAGRLDPVETLRGRT